MNKALLAALAVLTLSACEGADNTTTGAPVTEPSPPTDVENDPCTGEPLESDVNCL